MIANFLYSQYQTLKIIAALNEGKGSITTKFLENNINKLESGLRSSLYNETLKESFNYHLGNNEKWANKKHVKIALEFDRKKFSLIQLGIEKECYKFTLRYMCMYSIEKILEYSYAKINKEIYENLLEVLSAIIKDIDESMKNNIYEIANAEINLNEALICFNIVAIIISRLNNPFGLIKKYELTSTLNSSMIHSIDLIFKFKLVANLELENSLGKHNKLLSYKTTDDYLSGIFLFMNKLRKIKEPLSYGKVVEDTKSELSILTLIEKLQSKLINEIDTLKHIEALKNYIVEYMYDDHRILSRKTADDFLKLIKSKSINFTAPKSLSEVSNKIDPITNLRNRKILALIRSIMNDDKSWAVTILKYFMELIKNSLDNPELLFGLYKVIYSGITGETYDNSAFYKKFFGEAKAESKYEYNVDKNESKAIKGFIEIQGIEALIEILSINFCSKKNTEVKNDIISTMTSNLILEFLNIQMISNQLLKQPLLVMELAKCSGLRNVAAAFIRKLLMIAKYATVGILNDNINKNNYLPLALMDYNKNCIDKGNLEHMLVFTDAILDSLSEESEGTSSESYKLALYETCDLEALFESLKYINKKEHIGATLIFITKFIYGLQRCNDLISKRIKESNLIKNKIIYKFIKQSITKVIIY